MYWDTFKRITFVFNDFIYKSVFYYFPKEKPVIHVEVYTYCYKNIMNIIIRIKNKNMKYITKIYLFE